MSTMKSQNPGNQAIQAKWQKEYPIKVDDFIPKAQKISSNGQKLGYIKKHKNVSDPTFWSKSTCRIGKTLFGALNTCFGVPFFLRDFFVETSDGKKK